MSEKWIQTSEKMLDQISRLKKVEEKDRLDHVRLMRFTLAALHRSLLGWMHWVTNPNIMTRFAKEDIEEMSGKISEFTRSFIEYDLEVTKKGAEKGLKSKRRVGRRRRESTGIFYI